MFHTPFRYQRFVWFYSDFYPETAIGVHGFSVFFSWQFHFDKTAATAVGR
jgi:hypothetical protein